MRDRNRIREPNLDPNSCTEDDFAYFLRYEYPEILKPRYLIPSKTEPKEQKKSEIEIK